MLNQQIFLWVISNKEVYLSKELQEQLPSTKQHFHLIIDQFDKVVSQRLKEGKGTHFNNFLTFYLKKEGKLSANPRIQTNGSLKIITSFKEECPKHIPESSDEVCKDISSALMMQSSLVRPLFQAYIKAINDLLSNNRALCLDFHFCRIKFAFNGSSYHFRKSFLASLSQPPSRPRPDRIPFHGCPNPTCTVPKENQTSSSSVLYHSKWTEIQQGNLYSRPSLLQIQQLLDKGRQLQLKYSHFLC